MHRHQPLLACWLSVAVFILLPAAGRAGAQTAGTLRGRVVLEVTGAPLEHATVRIVLLRRSTETDEDGRFEFLDIPPGTYSVLAHMHALSDERRTVRIRAGEEAVADFSLRLAAVHAEVTVTASGQEQTMLETFQAVSALESLELATRGASSLGEVLEDQPGVAKRSFGPGTTRPVVRGFDGDRVLVLQDGVRTGTLSSQSGDHGEPIDAATLDRLEVVKGPATLLYGSNALGGVVNAITGHHLIHQHPHEGLRGYLTGGAGSANGQGGASGGFEYGIGKWMLWADGSGQRTGDYGTPAGRVENSKSRLASTLAGFGRFGDRFLFNLGYTLQDGRHGVPFAARLLDEDEDEEIDLEFRRHNLRYNFGVKEPARGLEQFQLALNYTDWNHREVEEGIVGTEFFNKQFVYRGVAEQKRGRRFSGSFGFWGMRRDSKSVGDEALAPPVVQNAFALFGLEEIALEHFRLQVGGRLEQNSYDPTGLRPRSFTGFSGAAGINVPLWPGGAFVTNFTHSLRAPALEELYNFGPHLGNLTFEIGNPDLRRERANGVDFALRHHVNRVHAELNLFHYRLKDFVFLAPTGETREGLLEARYLQNGARYRGAEAHMDVALLRNVWLVLGADAVNAELRPSGQPLPRIPPARGRVGLEARSKGFRLRPELLLARAQNRVFAGETATAGYAVANVRASYSAASAHAMHVFTVETFNLNNRLYRNHLSFIKELAPEIGRGVRFTYTVRFF